jgi:hypothetical protein
MKAYEDMMRNTATKAAPWFVVPADNKWFTRLVVAAAIIDALVSLDLAYPKPGKKQLEQAGRGPTGAGRVAPGERISADPASMIEAILKIFGEPGFP